MLNDHPRVRVRNEQPLREERTFVLYWMIASRRLRSNFGLERAARWARDLGKPLVVLEALRAGYRWASDRHHAFVLQGMRDNERTASNARLTYYPYVEPEPGAGRGLLEALAARAAVVVTDDFPCFFLPRMVAAAARKLDVRLEDVDGNGLYPLRLAPKAFTRAVDLRRYLQKELPGHLGDAPVENPLRRLPEPVALPREITERWPRASDDLLDADPGALADLPIDHSVSTVSTRGGSRAAHDHLDSFLERLDRYAEDGNHPDRPVRSQLSPYLHFGHIGAHEVWTALIEREEWSPEKLSSKTRGQREGYWGMSEAGEAFLDQLVTWRELGYVFCSKREDYDSFGSLPDWARETLEEHADDERPYLYSLEELAEARTHDDIWNAAQTELAREGRIHNYLRMLWGKKILEWSETPEQALEVLIELNNRYALDGRNPNSYSGIFWTLGRFDRAWGPERPIFGKVRYMSSDSTRKKIQLKDYLARYSPETMQQREMF